MKVLIAISACLLVSCNGGGKRTVAPLPDARKKTIVLLQPLSEVPKKFLLMLRDSIPGYLPVSVEIAKPAGLPAFAYYKPRNRYKADSLLKFLATMHGNSNIIAGITMNDISTRKGNVNDYGVMGLGLQPGNECVISLSRLHGDNPSQRLLMQRLLKTVVHELGHNFGLPHCPDKHCIMADAEGRLNQDNETGFCKNCKKKLGL